MGLKYIVDWLITKFITAAVVNFVSEFKVGVWMFKECKGGVNLVMVLVLD